MSISGINNQPGTGLNVQPGNIQQLNYQVNQVIDDFKNYKQKFGKEATREYKKTFISYLQGAVQSMIQGFPSLLNTPSITSDPQLIAAFNPQKVDGQRKLNDEVKNLLGIIERFQGIIQNAFSSTQAQQQQTPVANEPSPAPQDVCNEEKKPEIPAKEEVKCEETREPDTHSCSKDKKTEEPSTGSCKKNKEIEKPSAPSNSDSSKCSKDTGENTPAENEKKGGKKKYFNDWAYQLISSIINRILNRRRHHWGSAE